MVVHQFTILSDDVALLFIRSDVNGFHKVRFKRTLEEVAVMEMMRQRAAEVANNSG